MIKEYYTLITIIFNDFNGRYWLILLQYVIHTFTTPWQYPCKKNNKVIVCQIKNCSHEIPSLRIYICVISSNLFYHHSSLNLTRDHHDRRHHSLSILFYLSFLDLPIPSWFFPFRTNHNRSFPLHHFPNQNLSINPSNQSRSPSFNLINQLYPFWIIPLRLFTIILIINPCFIPSRNCT